MLFFISYCPPKSNVHNAHVNSVTNHNVRGGLCSREYYFNISFNIKIYVEACASCC